MLASSPLSSLVIAMSSKASCSVIIAQHLKGSWVVQELLLCQPSEAAIFGKGSSYLHLPLYLTLNSPHAMICLCLSDAWVQKKIFKSIYLCFFVSHWMQKHLWMNGAARNVIFVCSVFFLLNRTNSTSISLATSDTSPAVCLLLVKKVHSAIELLLFFLISSIVYTVNFHWFDLG